MNINICLECGASIGGLDRDKRLHSEFHRKIDELVNQVAQKSYEESERN